MARWYTDRASKVTNKSALSLAVQDTGILDLFDEAGASVLSFLGTIHEVVIHVSGDAIKDDGTTLRQVMAQQ